MTKKIITQSQLKKMLRYDPKTGLFTWIIKAANCIKVGDIAGHQEKNGYHVNVLRNKKYLSHRLVWLYVNGYLPENEIDHINRDKSDNRISNLRETTRQCNMRNKDIQKNNKSGVVGVFCFKSRKKYLATIGISGKLIHLGYYINIKDAVKARWVAECKYGFPNCNSTSTAYKYLKERGLAS